MGSLIHAITQFNRWCYLQMEMAVNRPMVHKPFVLILKTLVFALTMIIFNVSIHTQVLSKVVSGCLHIQQSNL